MQERGSSVPPGRERAYDYLKGEVLTDPAMQGQFINEQEIAAEIGVSRTPIREALLLLAAEELIQLVPQRGAYIAPVGGREITELFEIRGMIECYAARRALERTAVPLAAMQAEMQQQEQLVETGEAREFIDHDHRFHSALVAAVGNTMLVKNYDALRARQIRAGIVALFRVQDRRREVLTEHQAIVDALTAGDDEAAASAITTHLATTQQILLTA